VVYIVVSFPPAISDLGAIGREIESHQGYTKGGSFYNKKTQKTT
jgi:hypothetical protein